MNKKNKAIQYLLSIIDQDEDAQSDAKIYGNWIEHLKDYVEDLTQE